MIKPKIKTNTILTILAVIWFCLASYLAASTEYYSIISDKLADPAGTSTQFEDILNVFIIVVSFIPSGLLLAHPYVVRNYKDYTMLKTIILTIVIAFLLYIPFSWYNFTVNFGN